MINIKIENNIKFFIKHWNLINTKLIDSIINIYSWILSFYLKLNCEYVAVPNIEFGNEEIKYKIYFCLFQENNSKDFYSIRMLLH